MEISLEQYNKMAERLTELEYLLAEQRWIPCSERLPEEDGRYLATSEGVFGSIVYILSFGKPSLPMNSTPSNKRNWYMADRDGDFYWDDVIAWMELPEPWKGEQP